MVVPTHFILQQLQSPLLILCCVDEPLFFLFFVEWCTRISAEAPTHFRFRTFQIHSISPMAQPLVKKDDDRDDEGFFFSFSFFWFSLSQFDLLYVVIMLCVYLFLCCHCRISLSRFQIQCLISISNCECGRVRTAHDSLIRFELLLTSPSFSFWKP